MAKRKRAKTPLEQYLTEQGISQQEFAKRIAEIRGCVCYQSAVNRWVRGHTTPNREMRAYIARATHGQVPADVW